MGRGLDLAQAVAHSSPVYLPIFLPGVLAILFAQLLAQVSHRGLERNTAGGRKGGSLEFYHHYHN
jgi:hypothetical protein